MDQVTKQRLKNDQFITVTKSGMDWASENRRSVMVTTSILLGVIVLAVVSAAIYNHRSEQASIAFGEAMQTYQTPLAQPGEPTPAGVKTYGSPVERAKAANDLFMAVANRYGATKDGKVARYFGGLTYMEEGEYSSAESTLKTVANGWDSDLGSLAKLALAQLYRQTGRNSQAVDLYSQMTAKPTATVPAGLAQLQLAELYTSEGKPDQAKQVYAQLKDKDAKGAAGMLAAQKLSPGGPQQP